MLQGQITWLFESLWRGLLNNVLQSHDNHIDEIHIYKYLKNVYVPTMTFCLREANTYT